MQVWQCVCFPYAIPVTLICSWWLFCVHGQFPSLLNIPVDSSVSTPFVAESSPCGPGLYPCLHLQCQCPLLSHMAS